MCTEINELCRNLAPLDTTFEDDWGEWKPRSSSKCNWRRGRSKSMKQLTGPQVDHTTGTGNSDILKIFPYPNNN